MRVIDDAQNIGSESRLSCSSVTLITLRISSTDRYVLLPPIRLRIYG